MSIRLKIFIVLLVGLSVLQVFHGLTQHFVVLPSFIKLENNEAEQNLERAIRAIEREIHHLDGLVLDWSAWDDTITFIEDNGEDYEETNLVEITFSGNGLAVLGIYDKNGKAKYSHSLDPNTMKPMEYVGIPMVQIPPGHEFSPDLSRDIPIAEVTSKGILMAGGKAFIFSARPIISSMGKGPSHGTVVMAKILDEKTIKVLARQTHVDFSIITIPETAKSDKMKAILTDISKGTKYPMEIVEDDLLNIFAMVKDNKGKDAFLLKTSFPRKISKHGIATINNTIIIAGVAWIIIVLLILLILHFSFLTPLAKLTEHAKQIHDSGNYFSGFEADRKDEIGLLAGAFNRLLESVSRKTHELSIANTELEKLSFADGLTRINNRRYFDMHIDTIIKQLRREKRPLALLMCDIDYFKNYNDTYGHLAGDDCLRKVAAAISQKMRRPIDIVARYGGEEFAVLLPGTTEEGAKYVAESIRASVENMKIEHANSKVAPVVTLSIGICSHIPDGDINAAGLIAVADKALYESKSKGRNRTTLGQL